MYTLRFAAVCERKRERERNSDVKVYLGSLCLWQFERIVLVNANFDIIDDSRQNVYPLYLYTRKLLLNKREKSKIK